MKITVRNGILCYKKLLKSVEEPVTNFVWAYLQQEDASATLCCGRMDMAIYNVILQRSDGSREIFKYEDKEKATQLLEQLRTAATELAIGYTAENRERFQKG